MTLLTQDRAAGLQVLDNVSNEWLSVPAREGAVLVNSGNFLNDWR